VLFRSGISIPKCYGVIDTGEDIVERLKSIVQDHDLQNAGLVLKPIDGKGGHNISFYRVGADRQISFEYSSGKRAKLAQTRLIVQEVVTQDSYVNKLSRSINTVRFITALDNKGKAFTVGAYLRIGVDESYVDNLSRGGVAVKIDIAQGMLVGHPVNIHAEAIRSHDNLNEVISNFHIPYWNDVVALAHKVQEKISYHRLLGMDIAISSDGPVIIEVNSIYDNTGLEMVCGPMFSDKKVVDFFENNSLLFCEKQIKEIKRFHENINHVN
jgi:glutathione synthase/RimK-type ligase-like ATP-grasp enzyme